MPDVPLHVVDGSVYFFRGLFGIPDVFFDQRRRPVNGLKGYLHFLFDLLLRGDARYVVVAFDESLNTCFRNELYPDYKSDRPPPDANILYQLRQCRLVTRLLGVLTLADARFEADDIIATLVGRARRPVHVHSRDKDMLQLLRANVRLETPVAGVRTAPEFVERFGFAPRLFPDYQALQGDSVDNIPGVSGIGAKTAGLLVSRFGSLEGIYQNSRRWPEIGIAADSMRSRQLRSSASLARLYRELTRLRRQAPVNYATRDLQVAATTLPRLRRSLRSAGLLGHFTAALAQLEGNR